MVLLPLGTRYFTLRIIYPELNLRISIHQQQQKEDVHENLMREFLIHLHPVYNKTHTHIYTEELFV